MTRTGLTVLTVALAAAMLTGCGTDDGPPQYQGVCVDPNTQVRLDDTQCPGGHDGSGSSGMGIMEWILISQALGSNGQPSYIAPVGQRIEHVHTYRTVPAGGQASTARVPRSGGYASFSGGTASYSTKKPIWTQGPVNGNRPDVKARTYSKVTPAKPRSGFGGFTSKRKP